MESLPYVAGSLDPVEHYLSKKPDALGRRWSLGGESGAAD